LAPLREKFRRKALAVAAATLLAPCSLLPTGGFSGILEKGPKNVFQAIDKSFEMV
jgi:hypothetical protein